MNTHTLQLCGKIIEYALFVSQKSRSIRLAMESNGQLKLFIPHLSYHQKAQQWLFEKGPLILKKQSQLQDRISLVDVHSKETYLRHKAAALELIQARLTHFNRLYGYKINGISIRNQKTRWGSCSSKGTLNFNYQIALLPPHLADYIIVHELCHRGEMNHSVRFWNLVAKTCPDHLRLRAELRRYRLS